MCEGSKGVETADTPSPFCQTAKQKSAKQPIKNYMYQITRIEPGMTFGQLTVIERERTVKKKTYYRCACQCGKETVVYGYFLTTGKTRSCGCLRSHSFDMTRGCFPKVEVSEKAKNWIIKHYKHTKNDEIKAKYGLSDGWLHRFAREHGLKKSPQFMSACLKATTKAAALSHLAHDSYPPKGHLIPGRETSGFQKGITPLMRLGPKREAERVRKSAESRKKTWKLEHARMLFGLPRETKLRVFKQPREWTARRFYLRKLGYVIERGGLDAYFGETTRRSEALEARYKPFRFHPITELNQPKQ